MMEIQGAQQVGSAGGAEVRVSFWAGLMSSALGPAGTIATVQAWHHNGLTKDLIKNTQTSV